jgi:UTP--glucose-1-phosphate uridylyltransferase
MSFLDEIDRETRALLERYGFDVRRFAWLQEQVAAGVLSPASNVVEGSVEPPRPEEIASLPLEGTPAWDALAVAGKEALAAGRIGQVVLAGGMGTRFGGVVKGVVEALDGKSFLAWKLGETVRLARALGCTIPVALMTSFATDADTRRHVAGLDVPEPLWFSQLVAPRLTPAGEIDREPGGAPSLHGPGHGDLFEALRSSGVLGELRRRGVEQVQVSNVDNLGARLDPVVVGAHLLAGTELTVEVARKDGDAGGAPVRVDGRLVMLEAPRFPPGFDQDAIPVFNTNTSMFTLDALDREYDLTWLYVEKEVGERTVVQLERVYHEAAAFVETQFLEVPRHGPRGRFFPIKTPAELERSREALREMLSMALA